MTTRLPRAAAALAVAMTLAAPARAETPIDCANPACETRLSPACLSRVGAGSLPAGDACEAEQSAYVTCLRDVAETCGEIASPTRQSGDAGGCAPEDARQLYADLQTSDDAEALENFAELCAGTAQAGMAVMRAERIRAAEAAARSQAATGLGQFTGQWVPPGFPRAGCPSQLLVSSESGLLFVQAVIDDAFVRLGATKRVEYRRFLMRGEQEMNFEGEPLAMTGLNYTQDDGSVCSFVRPR